MKSFEVKIINDNDTELIEHFEISVTAVKNAIVLTPVIHVTILCDEDDGGKLFRTTKQIVYTLTVSGMKCRLW